MARHEYTDEDRAGTRSILREALFTYMDAHEDPLDAHGNERTYQAFNDLVDHVMSRIDVEVRRTVGPGTEARILQKLREGVL